eukprot:gene1562-1981_t
MLSSINNDHNSSLVIYSLLSFVSGICIGWYIHKSQKPTSTSTSTTSQPSSLKDNNNKKEQEYDEDDSYDDEYDEDNENVQEIETDMNCKMVLIARNDLGMTKGKIIAQCCHATLGAYQVCKKKTPKYLESWENYGQAKITLKVNSEEELLKLKEEAKKAGIVNYLVVDAGKTQIASGSSTVLALGPAPADQILTLNITGMADKQKKPAAAAKPAAKVAAKPAAKTAKKTVAKKGAAKPKTRTLFNALYTKKTRVFGTGYGVLPKRDLTHFTRWPRYVRIQRQRRVLLRRLKVPPTINQFTKVFDKNTAINLFKLLDKYRPEEKSVKKARLLKIAQERAAAPKGTKPTKAEKPVSFLHHGIDRVTKLVEKKKAKLVVIAHDVDPIEVVIWLPALCRRMDVPYCIVKSKSRLGQLIHMKKTSCVALTGVNSSDNNDLSLIVESAKSLFNNNSDARKQWGGNTLSGPTRALIAKKSKIAAKEASDKKKLN